MTRVLGPIVQSFVVVFMREADKILRLSPYLHSFISTYMKFLLPSLIKFLEKLINKFNR